VPAELPSETGLNSYDSHDNLHSPDGAAPDSLEERERHCVHELAVTESLLEIALRHGRGAGARRVTDLYLVIGQLSTYVDDSVQFYWDFVSQGTEAEGARLHFRRVPASFTCQTCGRVYELADGQLTCPGCGGSEVRLGQGDEFYLDSIEVEGAPEGPKEREVG